MPLDQVVRLTTARDNAQLHLTNMEAAKATAQGVLNAANAAAPTATSLDDAIKAAAVGRCFHGDCTGEVASSLSLYGHVI